MAYVKCIKCGTKISNVAGDTVKCPNCGHSMKLAKKKESTESDEKITSKGKKKERKKSRGCLAPILAAIVIILIAVMAIAMFGSGNRDNDKDAGGSPEKTESYSNDSKNTYSMGETWTVDGQWKLTVTSVEETQERNEFEERTPSSVYTVSYTYENIGYEDRNGLMDGLYFSLDESIVDSSGKMGYSYPNDVSNVPRETPVGASCDAQVSIGVENSGNFKIYVDAYDGNGKKQSAVFDIEIKK